MEYVPRIVKVTKSYLEELLNQFGQETRCCLMKEGCANQIVYLKYTDVIKQLYDDGWYITLIDENDTVVYDVHISANDNVHYGHRKISL